MTDQTPSRPPLDEWLKQRWKEGERAHDREEKGLEFHGKQVEAFSVLGIRTLGLVSAGGIVATLGFYSANYTRLVENAQALGTVNAILSCLFLALLGTLLCVLCAYLSQLFYMATLTSRERHWDHPYVRDTPRSNLMRKVGNSFRYIAVGSALPAQDFL